MKGEDERNTRVKRERRQGVREFQQGKEKMKGDRGRGNEEKAQRRKSVCVCVWRWDGDGGR